MASASGEVTNHTIDRDSLRRTLARRHQKRMSAFHPTEPISDAVAKRSFGGQKQNFKLMHHALCPGVDILDGENI